MLWHMCMPMGNNAQRQKSIIHLGATSAFVGDNTDIIIYTQALKFIRAKLINVINIFLISH